MTALINTLTGRLLLHDPLGIVRRGCESILRLGKETRHALEHHLGSFVGCALGRSAQVGRTGPDQFTVEEWEELGHS